MQGSKSMELAGGDIKSILWTLLFAIITAVLTALIDSVLPEMQAKGIIDASIAVLIITGLKALQKYVTDTRPLIWLMALSLVAFSSSAFAQNTTIDSTGVAAGSRYILTVNVDGTVSVSPTQVVKLSDLPTSPGPGPNPPPPGPLAPTVALSKLLAEQALAKPGATKQTGAGLSAVYSAVSREINTGGLDPKLATAAIAMGANEVFKKAAPADKAAWEVYTTSITRALSESSVNGDLATTGRWVATLDEFHRGIDLATGFTVEVTALASTNPDMAGILDGIDLKQLIELIKLVLEIIKAFKGL